MATLAGGAVYVNAVTCFSSISDIYLSNMVTAPGQAIGMGGAIFVGQTTQYYSVPLGSLMAPFVISSAMFMTNSASFGGMLRYIVSFKSCTSIY